MEQETESSQPFTTEQVRQWHEDFFYGKISYAGFVDKLNIHVIDWVNKQKDNPQK